MGRRPRHGSFRLGSSACLPAGCGAGQHAENDFATRDARSGAGHGMDGSADRGKSFSPQWLAMMAWAH